MWLNGYKNKTHIYAAYKRLNSALKTHTDTHRLKVKGWKKVFYTKRKKKARVSDKIDFKTKTVARHKEGITGSIQEDTTIEKIYTPNIRAPKYIKQINNIQKGRK